MSAAAAEVTVRLTEDAGNSMSPQHLTSTVWAFATLEVDPEWSLLSAVAHAMRQRAAECSPQEISLTAWAMAKLHARFSYGPAAGLGHCLFLPSVLCPSCPWFSSF
jgi:hypothetical protein